MASSASTVNGLSNEGSSSSVDNTPSVVPPSRPPFSFTRLLTMSEIDPSEFDWPYSFDEEPGEAVESDAPPGPGFKLIPLARRGSRATRVAKNERGNPEPFKEDWLLRKCSHCSAVKTPQWRYGPEGPSTLCNACGMRYRSGRLVPGYRPANTPASDSEKHSKNVTDPGKRKRVADDDDEDDCSSPAL